VNFKQPPPAFDKSST